MLNKIPYRYILVSLIAWIISSVSIFANDTIFVAKHDFPGPVNNVFSAKGEVYVKAGSSVYKRKGYDWEALSGVYKKYFVFYDKDFFQHDYIPKEFLIEDVSFMKHLIPQESLANAVMVQDGTSLFLSAGGSLFEYSVNTSYDLRMGKYSFRHIYHDQELTVLSTYKGIYTRVKGMELQKARGLNFSNGNFLRTPYGDFMASDFLSRYYAPDSFATVPLNIPAEYGKIRKGQMHGKSLVLMMTNSLCIYQGEANLKLVAIGQEFTDVESINDSLIFCTAGGKIYSYKNDKVREVGDLHQKIRDIFPINNGYYLATENGVFLWTTTNPIYILVADIPRCAAMVMDNEQNLWVGTDDGLYIVPNGEQIVIPFIEKVEFNRGALTYYQDTIFAGSIAGMYVIDNYSVTKNTIPAAISKVKIYNRNRGIMGALIAILIVVAGFAIRYAIHKKRRLSLPLEQKQTKQFSLVEMESDIIQHNIQTVDSLAEYLHTNPVQLNRIFKPFNTTPGRFLKAAKLKMAKNLLKEGIPIKEVAARIGYSVQLVKSELKKSSSA